MSTQELIELQTQLATTQTALNSAVVAQIGGVGTDTEFCEAAKAYLYAAKIAERMACGEGPGA